MRYERDWQTWRTSNSIKRYQLLSVHPIIAGLPTVVKYKKCKLQYRRHMVQGVPLKLAGGYSETMSDISSTSNLRVYGTVCATKDVMRRLSADTNMSKRQLLRSHADFPEDFWFKPFEIESPQGLYVSGEYVPTHLSSLGFRACTHPAWGIQSLTWLERAYTLRKKLKGLLLFAEELYGDWNVHGLVVRPRDSAWKGAVYIYSSEGKLL
jgi:hypothetical protein